MSRETNSLLLRYNLNVFWSNSISLSNKIYYKLKFNNFFNLFLHNYFLNILKLQYKNLSIDVYLYYFKEDRFSFLYKFLSLKKNVYNKLYFRKNFSLIALKKNKINQRMKYTFCFLFSLLHKIFISKLYFFYLKKKYITISTFSLDFFSKKKKKKFDFKKNKERIFKKVF